MIRFNFAFVMYLLVAFSSVGYSEVNRALQRPSSTNTEYSPDHLASKGVDGNANTNYHSAITDAPKWLRVDLGANYEISRIEIIHNFAGGSSAVNNKIYLLAATKDLQPDRQSSEWTTLASETSKPLQPETSFSITPAVLGRFVAVYSEATRASTRVYDNVFDEAGGILGLAELKVMGNIPVSVDDPTGISGNINLRGATSSKGFFTTTTGIAVSSVAGLFVIGGIIIAALKLSKDGEDGDERLAKVKHPKAKKGANSKTNGRPLKGTSVAGKPPRHKSRVKKDKKSRSSSKKKKESTSLSQ